VSNYKWVGSVTQINILKKSEYFNQIISCALHQTKHDTDDIQVSQDCNVMVTSENPIVTTWQRATSAYAHACFQVHFYDDFL